MSEGDVYSFLAERLDETIEEMFDKSVGKQYSGSLIITAEEEAMYIRAMKVCLNACMFLDEFGVKRLGPKNLKHYNRLSDRNESVKTIPIYYDFEQKIHLATYESSTHSGHSGIHLKPHWRRGFYKMQPFGVGRTGRKRIRIAPVLVNSHLFGGNFSQTKVEYA
jgi:hypothetical protein